VAIDCKDSGRYPTRRRASAIRRAIRNRDAWRGGADHASRIFDQRGCFPGTVGPSSSGTPVRLRARNETPAKCRGRHRVAKNVRHGKFFPTNRQRESLPPSASDGVEYAKQIPQGTGYNRHFRRSSHHAGRAGNRWAGCRHEGTLISRLSGCENVPARCRYRKRRPRPILKSRWTEYSTTP